MQNLIAKFSSVKRQFVQPLAIRKLPDGMSLKNPAIFLATWGGTGLIKPASGTWGTVAAVPFSYAIMWIGGPLVLAIATVICFAIGIYVADIYGKQSGEHDAESIVIDEVSGMWLASLVAGTDKAIWLMAFLLFRLFDIIKPFPASFCDEKIRNSWGVMLDDIVAGLYTLVLLIVVLALFQM